MEKLQLNQIGQSVKIPNELLSYEPTHTSRYLILASMLTLLGSPKKMKILDVGGKKGLLGMFPGFAPTIIDIEDSDEPNFVKGSALAMPFKDGQFEYSISCDVLEHIEAPDREKFLSEMLRVSSKGVILCAPFNSQSNEQLESEMNDYYYHLSGQGHRWLKEHIDNGLPSEAAVERQLQKLKLGFVKFRHFSPLNWRTIVKYHLLHTAFGDNEVLEKSVHDIYRKYYKNMCGMDFSEAGYRTFFWISKTGTPQVVLPKESEVAKAVSNFQHEVENIKIDVLEREMKSLREHMQHKNAQAAVTEELRQKLAKADSELKAIKTSRAWRAVSRARTVHSRVRNIIPGKKHA